jgi:hypothetical protein
MSNSYIREEGAYYIYRALLSGNPNECSPDGEPPKPLLLIAVIVGHNYNKIVIPFRDDKGARRLLTALGIFTVMYFLTLLSLRIWLAQFPLLELTDELDDKIVKITYYQSKALIRLENGYRLSISPSSNYNYKPYELNKFVQKGDRLFKRGHMDTLNIIRNDSVYTFLIGDDLNEDLQRQ